MKKSVFFVDDSKIPLASLRDALGDGVDINYVNNPITAMLRVPKVNPDFILLDYNLSIGTSERLIQSLLKQGRKPKGMAVITGSSDISDVKKSINKISTEIQVIPKDRHGMLKVRRLVEAATR